MANPPPDALEPAISQVICSEESTDAMGTAQMVKGMEGGEVEDPRNDFKVTCVICDLTYGKPCPDTDEAEKPVMLACGHIFGHNCIKQWLDQRDMLYPAKCPYCRFQLQFKRCKCLLVPLLAHTDYTPASIKESEVPDECYDCEYLSCEDRLWHREMGRIDVELEDLEWKLRKAKSALEERKMPKVQDVVLEFASEQPVVDIIVEDVQSEKFDIAEEQPDQELKIEIETGVETIEQPEQNATVTMVAEPEIVSVDVETRDVQPADHIFLIGTDNEQPLIIEIPAVLVEVESQSVEHQGQTILVEHEIIEPTSQDVEMDMEAQSVEPENIELPLQNASNSMEIEQPESIERRAQEAPAEVHSQTIEPAPQDAISELDVIQPDITVEAEQSLPMEMSIYLPEPSETREPVTMETEARQTEEQLLHQAEMAILSANDPEKVEQPYQIPPLEVNPEKDLIIIISQPPAATEPPAPPKTEEELLLAISDAENAIKTYEDGAFQKLNSVERKIAEKRIRAANAKKFLDSWRVSWRGVQTLGRMDEWPKSSEGGEPEILKEENMVRAAEWLKWRRESRGRSAEVIEEDNDEYESDEVEENAGENIEKASLVQADEMHADVHLEVSAEVLVEA